MRFIALTSVLFLVTTLASAVMADTYTYKWRADNGTTQYTQIPPVDRPYTRVRTSSKSSKVESQPNPAPKTTVDESASNGEKALAETEAQAQQEKVEVAQQRASNCENSKKNLIILQSRPRVRIPMANGEYKVLSEEEKQAKIEETKKMIIDDCN